MITNSHPITIFTPTFNRGYIIHILYNSLLAQTVKNFEWLIIDDGSTDNTKDLVRSWIKKDNGFEIRYYNVENGGKQRAINLAVNLANYEYFFIVDSDDQLIPTAIELIQQWLPEIHNQPKFAGVSGLRCNSTFKSFGNEPLFNGKSFIDCNNLDRSKFNLEADCAEIYKTNILKKYQFPVWQGEKFTPECVVWDAIALDGYNIRWYNYYIYICEYLPDGLTKGGYKLYSQNLMGCAMANNIKLKSTKKLKKIYDLIIEIIISCILSKNISYLKKIEFPIIAYALLPIGFIYAIHRKRILKKFLCK